MGDEASEERDRRVRVLAIGAVSAGVVHELTNALAVAASSLFLAQRSLDNRTALERHLGNTASEIQKAQAVMASVMSLARGEPLRLEPTNISDLIGAARRNAELPASVAFRAEVEPSDLEVPCDAVLMERVLTNLLLNARDAIVGRAKAEIVVRSFRDGGKNWVTVADNGVGIEPALAQRLFEPLTTNKANGTGLGLSLCKTIAHAHDGDITAESTSGAGTTLRLWLP